MRANERDAVCNVPSALRKSPHVFDSSGEAGDSPVFPLLLDIGPDVKPRAAVADKGYDSKANRAAARERGICPAIPYKANAKNRPVFFPKTIYRGRAGIEQTFGKLKCFKRVALRCEKIERISDSIVSLALGFILIKSVHTAKCIEAVGIPPEIKLTVRVEPHV